MNLSHGFLLACAVLAALGAPSGAQTVTSQPTSDLLTSAHAADSLRRAAARREAALAPAGAPSAAGGLTWTILGLETQADPVHRTYSTDLASSRWQLLSNVQTSW